MASMVDPLIPIQNPYSNAGQVTVIGFLNNLSYTPTIEELNRTILTSRELSPWDRARLELLRMSELGLNWDGENAQPVMEETVRTATVLLNEAALLADITRAPDEARPKIIPSPNGSITFKFVRADKELKCIVNQDMVEVLRWQPLAAFEAENLWEVPVSGVPEHIAWLLG
jgi:hypothetical protein